MVCFFFYMYASVSAQPCKYTSFDLSALWHYWNNYPALHESGFLLLPWIDAPRTLLPPGGWTNNSQKRNWRSARTVYVRKQNSGGARTILMTKFESRALYAVPGIRVKRNYSSGLSTFKFSIYILSSKLLKIVLVRKHTIFYVGYLSI